MKRLVLGITAVVMAGACGLKRVPGNVLEKLPYEARIELLESENDLALAVDRLDEARNEVSRTRDQIRRAKDRLSAAKSEVGAATDAPSREVADLAVVEAEKRVAWLRASQALNVKDEDLAQKNLDCAHARYSQITLAAARKAKLEGSEKLDPEVFHKQLARCEEEYAELRERLKTSTSEADAVHAEWVEARASLARKTFDARASPYVE